MNGSEAAAAPDIQAPRSWRSKAAGLDGVTYFEEAGAPWQAGGDCGNHRTRDAGRDRFLHEPSEKPTMKPESRDALLIAIAKARKWIEDIRLGRLASFAEIAEREAVGERHIRLLAPLAFLSPRIIAAIADGTAPADLTVTGLAKALPYSWAEQA